MRRFWTTAVPWLLPVLAGAWMACTPGFNALHNADSVIPALVSVQRWTFFYWDQDRYGMLLPLLAMPLRDPMENLLAQNALSAAAGLLGILLAVGLFAPVRRGAWGALAGCLPLLLLPPLQRFEALSTLVPYAPSFALGCGALLLARRPGGPGRMVACAVLVFAALWVNIAMAALLAPLILALHGPALLRGGRGRDGVILLRRPGVWPAVVAVFSLLVLQAVMQLSAEPGNYGPAALALWPGQLARFFPVLWRDMPWVMVCAAAALAGGAALWRHPRMAVRRAARGATAWSALACWAWLLMGVMRWTAENHFGSRYGMLGLFPACAATGCLALALSALAGPGRWRAAASCAVAAAFAAGVLMTGLPSLRQVREVWEARVERPLAPPPGVLAVVLAGDYWTVWPTVFLLRCGGENEWMPEVHGLALRCAPTAGMWTWIPPGKVAVLVRRGEEGRAGFAARGLGMRLVPEAEAGASAWRPARLEREAPRQ